MNINKIIYFVITAISVFFVNNLYAGGWYPLDVTIYEFTVEGSDTGNTVYVQFNTSDAMNPDSCSGANPELKRIYADTAKGKMMFAAIMSAKAASQKVRVSMNGCDNWGRPIIDAVIVR